VDYITSPTALLFPIEKIVSTLLERGIDCLVDGAHAPGHVPLNIEKLGAAYFAGNCHKWICSPKGSAFIHIRKDKQHLIHPMIVSHHYDKHEKKEREWSNNFFWPGTNDYTAYLCVKDAIEFMGSIFQAGWNELRQYNRQQCLNARQLVSEKTGIPLPAPEEMIVNLAAFDLGETKFPASHFNYISPLWEKLYSDFKIELPVLPWNRDRPRLFMRFSSQCYNSMEQYDYLAEALKTLPSIN